MAKEVFLRSKPHVNVAAARTNLGLAGLSAAGAEQVLNGQLITDPADRNLVAEIVRTAAAGGLPHVRVFNGDGTVS